MEKWHDLSKRPDDLPKEDVEVLCAWKSGSIIWYDVMVFHKSNSDYFMSNTGPKTIVNQPKLLNEGQVLAWKEIEEFEA